MNPSVQMMVETFSGGQVLKSVGRYVSHCCVKQVEQHKLCSHIITTGRYSDRPPIMQEQTYLM